MTYPDPSSTDQSASDNPLAGIDFVAADEALEKIAGPGDEAIGTQF